MNNAIISTEEEKDAIPVLREKADHLADIVDALSNVASSNYWQVLKQNVFDVDLDKAKRSLASEKDTTEIFRLQGEIRWGEKFDLEKLLNKYRNELKALRNKI